VAKLYLHSPPVSSKTAHKQPLGLQPIPLSAFTQLPLSSLLPPSFINTNIILHQRHLPASTTHQTPIVISSTIAYQRTIYYPCPEQEHFILLTFNDVNSLATITPLITTATASLTRTRCLSKKISPIIASRISCRAEEHPSIQTRCLNWEPLIHKLVS